MDFSNGGTLSVQGLFRKKKKKNAKQKSQMKEGTERGHLSPFHLWEFSLRLDSLFDALECLEEFSFVHFPRNNQTQIIGTIKALVIVSN
jgi:hypothetical protein